MPHSHSHFTYPPHPEEHRSHRAGWLRAAVLGANDGLVSTACVIVAMVGAGAGETTVRTAGIAGLVAGALSMAVGEYVSVASQRDTEEADLEIEARALEEHPRAELAELTGIYVDRGLTPELAAEVARELTAVDALGAHARDEIGLTEVAQARPVQAALSSGAAFTVGALVPLMALWLVPDRGRSAWIFGTSLVALAGLGAVAAAIGGARRLRATARVAIGGCLAMLVTLGVGEMTGAVLG